jgi:lipoprotein NlpI
MRLGSQDASMFFHRGMIEKRLGQTAAAIDDLTHALHINPYFSLLWSPVARETLASLSGGL